MRKDTDGRGDERRGADAETAGLRFGLRFSTALSRAGQGLEKEKDGLFPKSTPENSQKA